MILDTDRDELLRAIHRASLTATASMDAGIEVQFYPHDGLPEAKMLRMVSYELTETEFEFTLEDGQTVRQPVEGYRAYREEDGFDFILDNDKLVFRIKRVVPVHVHFVRIYTADTDAYGMVYYANPLRFMEAARVEMFRSHGITPPELEALGFDFPVVDLEVKYPSPARADDLLEIRTKLLELAGAHILLDQSIRRQKDNCLCYDACVKLACVSTATGKPDRIPKELRKLVGIHRLTNE